MPAVTPKNQPTDQARKPTKNEQRRAKKKQQKQEQHELPASPAAKAITETPAEPDNTPPTQPPQSTVKGSVQNDVAVPELDELPPDDPLVQEFSHVLARFKDDNGQDDEDAALKAPKKPEVFYDDDDNIQGEDEEAETKQRLSKKARKEASKLSIAELKALVRKPEIVEWTDVNASDPKLLVNIKGSRNVVPVPSHWSLKREYLSSKRGIEKSAFVLPKFILETGIAEMREAVLEKNAQASLKQRQRERVQPKMNKMDIDYQVLFEAFFRRQTKPHLSRYGEVYFEGKEFETNLRHLRPGQLGDELREALNMPIGAPPPWLINMQKVGMPPSYPALRVPGLNAPPPPGQSWGLHPGGYGKPPVDEQNRPLYGGDVFGMGTEKDDQPEPIDKTLWGELPPHDDEEPDEEDDEEDEEDEDDDADETDPGAHRLGVETPFGGTETPGGIASTIPTSYMGAPPTSDDFTLRKDRRAPEAETGQPPRAAGTVLGERQIRAEGFFGGERAYDLSGAAAASKGRAAPPNVRSIEADDRGRKRKAGDLDVSIDLDALTRDDRMTKDQVSRQYEHQRTQQGAGGWKGAVDREDLSGMVAEESAKRQKRESDRRGRK